MAKGGDRAVQPPRWWATLLYVPVLFAVGWLISRPLLLLTPGWGPDQVDLAGLVVALLLLLLTLPRRLQRVWGDNSPWQRLGVLPTPAALAPVCLQAVGRALLRGLLKALLLLGPLTLVLLVAGQARWLGDLGGGELLNALALVLGVGFAEELLFRGWPFKPTGLRQSGGRLQGFASMAAGRSPHQRSARQRAALRLLAAGCGLVGGLTLLGLVLALQRRADGGLLWGAVGLHGGLVGGWFALQNGLIQLSPAAPAWLVGPGGASPNPIGGLVGWLGLLGLLWVRRRWWRQPTR